MKQHITPKQAKEITKEQFYRLIQGLVDRDDWSDYHHKNMTIGKMIEILRKQYTHNNNIITFDFDNQVDKWFIEIEEISRHEHVYSNYEDECLCDALWDAVKSMLSE